MTGLPKVTSEGFSMDRKTDETGNLSAAARRATTENAPVADVCETRKDTTGVLAGSSQMIRVGLRIDVDTLRGTSRGVPVLLETLRKHNIKAGFFFSVGPDNMGRNLWRLLKPKFLWKMLRTKATSLYGWDILLMGTAWPGPKIGKRCAEALRATLRDGHEIGLHAWDHRLWQAKIDVMKPERIARELDRAYETITAILGTPPSCSAAPGWRCTEQVLVLKEKYHFRYNSDCRGDSVFMPVVNGTRLATPQIPLSLPTYDELLGRDGVTNENYNARLLELIKPGAMNLLTIHAEVEGGVCAAMFEEFLQMAEARHIEFVPPGALLPEGPIPDGKLVQGEIPGREGILALQG